MVDPHTIATFAFAQMRRDPTFGPRFPWVRNTVVCVETDLADDILSGQMVHYFPGGGTIACYYPTKQRFMFIWIDAPYSRNRAPKEYGGGTIVMHDTLRQPTIGMLMDSLYKERQDDRSPSTSHARGQFGEASTAEIEKILALV